MGCGHTATMQKFRDMFTRRELTVLALMALVHFTLIVDFMIVMPQGPQLMRQFGITAGEFSRLVSMYTLGAGLLSLVAAFFLDRLERKRSLIAALALFALGNAACAIAPDFEALVLARAATGAMAGVVGALVFAIVSDSIDISRRGSAMGLVLSSFAFASIAGVPLCLVLSSRYGWGAPFHFICALSLVSCAALARWLPRVAGHLVAPRPASRVLGELRELFSDRGRNLALLFMACLILGHFSVNPFLFPSVIANSGVPESRLPIIYLAGGLASLVASVAFGKLSDRFGKKLVFALALLASLAPIWWVTHLEPMGILPAALIVASYFVVMGGRMTPAMALVTSTSRPETRGSFLSLIGSVQQLSAALAAFAAGLMVTRAEDGKLLGFGKVGLFAAAFSLLALWLCLRISPVEHENG
jgi:MFS transporter, DHA1 family, inner membrane transport protein